MARNADDLQLPTMSVQGMWTPESGREPTPEELLQYSMSQGRAPAEEPPTAPERTVEPGPATELPTMDIRAWTPESGREPSPEELLAYSSPTVPVEQEGVFRDVHGNVVPEPEPKYTPEEVALRQTPGAAPAYPELEGYIHPEDRPPPPPPPQVMIEDDFGQIIPEYVPQQRQSLRPVTINPINMDPRETEDPGRFMSAIGSFSQGVGSLIASVPKTVALWFAPDTDMGEWMDEMDRIDSIDRGPGYEQYDRSERIRHMAVGSQKFGTAANVFSAEIMSLYLETAKNTGEELQKNRALARAMYVRDLASTMESPSYRAGEAFDEAVRNALPTNPEYAEEFLNGKIPAGLGSVVGYMAVFAATRKLPGGKVSGGLTTAGTGITVQQSFAFSAALEGGADIETAFEAAFGIETMASGASEAVPIFGFFNRADKASGGAIKLALIRMIKQGSEEAIQEGFQTIMENMTAQKLYDPERQWWGGTGEAGAVGFTTGAIVEAISSLLIPGRTRGTQERGAAETGATLEETLEAARQGAEDAGGDQLDQTLTMSELNVRLAEGEAAWQAGLKERLKARQEAREARPEERQQPLAELVTAEADIARLPFEQRAEAVLSGVAAQLAEDKAAAFERAEAEQAAAKEAEVQEAEYQQEIQKGEERMEVGEAIEAAEEVQGAAEPATIGEAIEPEAREGLERMRVARAEKVTEAAPSAKAAPRPVAALPAPSIKVTPEGEALLPAAAAEREAARGKKPTTGQIERPFAVGEEVDVAAETERATALTEQLELPVNEVTEAAQEASTSPTNALTQPTDAQKEAGNYAKGHLTPNQTAIPGVNVTIENPAGSVRSGQREDGSRWSQDMKDHYGYIKRTESAEGPEEQLDVFINPQIMEEKYDTVFVVDQVNDDGNFDEHKVMMGYRNQMDAVRAYKRNYPRNQKVGTVTPMSKIEFRKWLETGDQTTAVAKQPTAPEALAGEEEFSEIAARRRRGRGARREREPTVRFRAGEEVSTARARSRMREAVEKSMPKNLPVDRVQEFLERQAEKGAFRTEEAEFYDIASFLEGREGTISKEELMDYLDFRRLDVVEEMLETDRQRVFTSRDLALSHLTDLYGELNDLSAETGNVRDKNGVLIAFLFRPEGSKGWHVTYKMKTDNEPMYSDHQAIMGGTNYREILIKLPRKPGRFLSRFMHRHWPGHENVIAYARVADFIDEDGNKTLVVLEVQSDWHQTGRKEGYVSAKARLEYEGAHGLPNVTDQWLEDTIGSPYDSEVEEAPFKKSWPIMVMRRMFEHAVRGGYDNVAWTTGEQQAELYGELIDVDELVYRPEHKNLEVLSDGNFMTVEGGREEFEKVIGKEYTDQLMDAADERQAIRDQYSIEEEYNEEEKGFLVVDPNGEYVRTWGGDLLVMDSANVPIDEIFLYNESLPGVDPVTIKGTSLQFGGEGLKSFYDKELVNVVNKFVKRFGTSVVDSRVGALKDDQMATAGWRYEPVHSVEVTPELQVSLIEEGLPLFRAEEEVEAEQRDRVPVRDAKKIVQPLVEQMKRIRPKILANPLQAPQELQNIMRQRGAMNAKGVFYQGRLYIFAENHTEPRDVVRTLLHEGVAHMGLRAIYTNEAELDSFLDEVYGSMTDADIKSLQGKSRVYAAIDLDTAAGRRELAEEHIAEMAESDPQNNFIQRLVAAVRQFLRYAGMELEWSNSDIVSLLADARRELAEFVPTNRITVISEVEDAATGEVVEVEERADIAVRQIEKRQGVIQSLRECIA